MNGGVPSAAISGQNSAWQAGLERQEAREKALASEENKRRRDRSKTEFESVSASEALQLAKRDFPDVFEMPLFDGTNFGMGARVIDHRGKGAALVEDATTGRRALMQANLPLQADDDGTFAPVDLSLEASEDALRSDNALAPLSIDRTSRAKVAFTDVDFSVELADGAEERSAQRAGDRSFFAELRTDTDAVIVPTATGAELGVILRSARAGERQVLRINLPAGASARRAQSKDPIPNDPPQSVEIVRGDRTLGYIHPPNAFDADGRNVSSRMSVEGDTIVIDVDHRGRDLRYPIFADPEVNAYGDFNQDWPGWAWGQALREPRNYSVPEGYGAARNDCAYYCGLYQSHPTGTYNANGSYAHWYFQAPLNTYIYRAVFGGIAHDGYDVSGRNHTDSFQGVINSAYTAYEGMQFINQSGDIGPNPFGPAEEDYWGVTHDFCVNPGSCSQPTSLSEQNYALFGIHTLNKFGCCGLGPAPQKGTTTMAHALVYIGDRRAPYFKGGLPSDRAWRDDNDAVSSVSPSAHDDGLGLYAFTLSGASSGDGLQRVRSYVDGRYDCSGSPHFLQCPSNDRDGSTTIGYRPNEGETRLTLGAQDAVSNNASSHSWVERIDRSRPSIDVVSGTLHAARERSDDHRYEGLTAASYALHVEASDAHSGLQDVEVFFDGASQRARGGYSAGRTLDWTLRPDDYAEGRHRLDIVARDNLAAPGSSTLERHQRTVTFYVYIDRRGDIYHAEEYDESPANGGQRLREEWAQLATRTSRVVDEDQVTTRLRHACDGQHQTNRSCDQYRSVATFFGDAAKESGWTRHTGYSNDANVPDASTLAAGQASGLGTSAAEGPIYDVTRPWQHLPPGTSRRYLRFDAAAGDDGTPAYRSYVERDRMLPLKSEVLTADGSVASTTFWDYDLDRHESVEYAPEFFKVERPQIVASETEVDQRQNDTMGPQRDTQTGGLFTPQFLGGAFELTAIGAFCLASSDVVRHDIDRSEVSVEPDPTIEPGQPQAAETSVSSNYLKVTDVASCLPGSAAFPQADFDVLTMARASTSASAWRQGYEEVGEAIIVGGTLLERLQGGITSLIIGTEATTVYTVPRDDGTTSALFDYGDATVIVTGAFKNTDLDEIVIKLRPR